LSSFITQCASIGCAKTKDVISIVEAVLMSKGNEVHISNGW